MQHFKLFALQMVDFRSLLKEVILLNNRLKEYRKQHQVCNTMTSEKENVQSDENGSGTIKLLPGFENELRDFRDSDKCISHSTEETLVDQNVHNSVVDTERCRPVSHEDCVAVQVNVMHYLCEVCLKLLIAKFGKSRDLLCVLLL